MTTYWTTEDGGGQVDGGEPYTVLSLAHRNGDVRAQGFCSPHEGRDLVHADISLHNVESVTARVFTTPTGSTCTTLHVKTTNLVGVPIHLWVDPTELLEAINEAIAKAAQP